MFTGLIEAIATVEALAPGESGTRLTLSMSGPSRDLRRGESIAVNGICLTALPMDGLAFAADVSPETLRLTTLGTWKVGTVVNIERSLALGDRLGGHLVQGHVDAVGRLLEIEHHEGFATYRWSFPRAFGTMIVSKGSIAVDGISLTVVDPEETTFAAALIPETLARTNLGRANIGDSVNLEFDIIAKYAQKLLAPYRSVADWSDHE